MPSLEKIHRDFAERGVRVLGVYHPKPPRPVDSGEVARFCASLGITFPIAIDPEWRLVESWWLERTPSAWTSVTWVLDRAGTIRFVHPGGEYHTGGGREHARCREDERALRELLEKLVTEK